MTDPSPPPGSANGNPSPTEGETAVRDPLFSDLFRVSHQLRDAFEPVQARPGFVAGLRNQLEANVENARRAQETYARRRQRMRWTAFGVGGAVYLAGLAVVTVRAVRWLIGRRQRAAIEPDAE